MDTMRKIAFLLLLLLPFARASVFAQFEIVRGDCTPDVSGQTAAARGQAVRRLPAINTNWDENRIYRQLVILMSFSDTEFQMEQPQEAYDAMFNENGYHQRNGAGCVADYFRDQSNGLLNLQFDVFGPFNVGTKAQPYDNPTDNTKNYGKSQMAVATRLMLEQNPDIDYSVYDWNGDRTIEQVIIVYAGLSGNTGSSSYGHIWPNTSSLDSPITTPDGHKISNYTASGEHWPTTSKASCGIGTICHEFSHSLGLPDLYPVNGWAFSAVDEWDLMDGGNFTNYGFCPPNYSPLEKMLLGWLTPVELTEPATITQMKPVARGGEVYKISHTANEYLLLENRQWEGWDYGLPGRGLVIYHVNYDAGRWRSNTVNNVENKLFYSLVNADNLNYEDWETLLDERGQSKYAQTPHLHNRCLSTSSYPWHTDSTETVNDQLTDTSTPAARMYNANAQRSYFLSKSVTNIRTTDDGLVSFDFMGGETTGIQGILDLTDPSRPATAATYHLSGRQTQARSTGGILLERKPDGTVRKVIK